MLWISRTISKIENLVNEGTPSSLAYAALEARLAIERVCYERLVNAHSYISHADLKNWQPAKIVMTLIEEVEPKIASSFTLSITAVRLKGEQFQLVGYLRSKGFGFAHGKSLI